ncbi:MAG: hypothetical protein H6510_01775 [Acidobacteria bacterium]|nr:hypothetical protein [Acidobacteriota bacterium]MCB9396520.1 hypothetical protein [Acidobacteriota bacterium]
MKKIKKIAIMVLLAMSVSPLFAMLPVCVVECDFHAIAVYNLTGSQEAAADAFAHCIAVECR